VPIDGNTLTIIREFKRPPRAVFAAWANPTAMARWIGAEGFTAPTITSDFRVGGGYEVCLRSPGGEDYWWGGKYLEIDEPNLLRMSVNFYGTDGESTRHSAPENRITVRFEAIGTGTRMAFRQEPLPLDTDRAGHEGGWVEAFDKLERRLNEQALA
jgi:uncharacterized protein YndB with AHSA1/START domain